VSLKIDFNRIVQSIASLDISPVARETGAGLVDAWISTHGAKDSQNRILAVETGFVLWLDELTVAIGVQDLIDQDSIGIRGNEWKSAKEPRRDAKGRETSWWNETVWIREISTGSQISLYALALNRGTYYDKAGESYSFSVQNPRVRVRAAVKSNPVRFWPKDPSDPDTPELYEFSSAQLEDIAAGYRAKAAQIRCARRSGLVPWQLPGMQCHSFNRECQFFGKYCSKHVHPTVLEDNDKAIAKFDPTDPATQLSLIHIDPEKLADPDVVIISASQYSLASQCLEKYRLINGLFSDKEEQIELQIGTALHAGVAEFYKQVKEQQNVSN